jgi:uncharacterized 2Fe-2S/4Fe-4S cluster protein (DUF4445 family)
MNTDMVKVRLEPLSVEVLVPRGAELIGSLAEHGVEFPCGGTGVCGGCSVRVLAGSLAINLADRAVFSSAEIESGWRLACQARAREGLVLHCEQWQMHVLADASAPVARGKHGLGIAIDLGTTTIAAQMMDLKNGTVLSVETELNPQARFGSDVMSRIQAALDGRDLTGMVRSALGAMVAQLARGREVEVVDVLLVGNTVMHHLFAGCDVGPLSHVPFASPNLGTQSFAPDELGWMLPAGCRIRFAPCLGGFVGSDILAGIVATGMAGSDELVALVDLGTNGEIAIGDRNRIVCASTAAGPAFEAGAIRMGMRAVTGAISHVAQVGDELRSTVIGDVEPRGICGSGLVDAVAAGLRNGAILPSGRIADGAKVYRVAGPVVLYQSDIRELQLAKGAIAAGFRILLRKLGAQMGAIRKVYLAGAFGNYVQIESAIRIGLIEAPRAVIHAAGNTALRGAKNLLATEEPRLTIFEHISLAANPRFQDEFVDCMGFPAHDLTDSISFPGPAA